MVITVFSNLSVELRLMIRKGVPLSPEPSGFDNTVPRRAISPATFWTGLRRPAYSQVPTRHTQY
jgi:hypothetical protein